MAGKVVKTAVVGLGTVGSIHAQWCATVPESRLVAVCDADERRAQEVARTYGVDFHSDYEAVLDRSDVDAVIIATPNHLHADIAIAAVRAGKHIAVEKPLCTTLEDAETMIAAVRESGVKAQYFENLCFSPAYHTAKEIVDRGGLGNIVFVRCCENSGTGGFGDTVLGLESVARVSGEAAVMSWLRDPVRAGGGMLLTTGCHSITYIYHLLGRPKPERVYAELVPDGARLEAAAYVTIRFSDGRVAWVDSSATHALGGFDDRAEIYGTRGTVFLDLYRSTGIKVFSQEGYGDIGQSAFALIPSETTNWSHPIVDERWSLGYEAELRHFLCCVRDDSDPSVTLDDGKLTLKIVLAAYEAGRTHKSVEMSEASTGR